MITKCCLLPVFPSKYVSLGLNENLEASLGNTMQKFHTQCDNKLVVNI